MVQMLKPRVAVSTASRVGTVVQANGAAWRQGKTSTQRGYGYKWQQARAGFLRSHPLCRMCEAGGRYTAATVVDHITPHRGDMAAFWNSANWQSLCATCHSSAKQRDENRDERGGW
jgi:5-methylcytosine-specific restriction protein A